jgi:4-diphosphocytidyl-2-C-methyl-D-erythritol kinase
MASAPREAREGPAPETPGTARRARREAPAKINAGLRIRGRRADGYHLLESLFLPLALADEVSVAWEGVPASGPGLELSGETQGLPGGEDNLAARAARAFLEAAAIPGGARVRLHKRIPVAAGLGGGSSDAAAVLLALDALHPGALGPAALLEVALSLGADVPFFLDPRPAWVEGIGERRTPAPDLPALGVLLVSPGEPLATAAVYAAFDAALTPAGAASSLPAAAARGGPAPRQRTEACLRAIAQGGAPDAAADVLHNDLEPAASRLCPAVGMLRRRLDRSGAAAVGLSGSGPTLFGLFATEARAREAQRRLRLEPPARSLVTATRASRSA